MMFHEPEFAVAQQIVSRVRRRFRHDADKRNRFSDLIRNYAAMQDSSPTPEQSIRDNESLLSELNSLFTGQNKDLMTNINILWDMAASAEPRVVMPELDEESSNVMIQECCQFVNKIQQTVSYDKFNKLIEMLKAYQDDHHDAERVHKEAYSLLKEHPELEIILGGQFLAEAKHGGTPVPEMLASRKRRRDELEDRLNNVVNKVRKLSREEESRFEREDKMHKDEYKYNRMLCARDSLQKLLRNCSGRNSMGVLAVRDYLTGLDLICLRKEFEKKRKYLLLLNDEHVEVGEARAEADKILRGLEKKMDVITNGWEEEKEMFTISSHEEASRIETFDWRKYRTTS